MKVTLVRVAKYTYISGNFEEILYASKCKA